MELLTKGKMVFDQKALRLFLLFFLVINMGTAFSFQIYVSPSGNNNNPGTMEKPLASLSAARDLARSIREGQALAKPIEIIIASGTYNLLEPLELTAEDSGTDEAPLIFRGEKGSTPVFSGGMELPAFEEVSERLWKITIPEIALYGGSIQQLFVNGERATRARTPNGRNFFKTKKASEFPIDTTEGASVNATIKKVYLTSEQLDSLGAVKDEDLQNVIISIHHAWDRTRKYIQAKSIEDSAVYIIGGPMHSWNKLDNSSQFYFENSRAFLDAPGEWFLESNGDLFYVPRKGERIETSKAITPVIDKFLVIRGDKEEKVENIHFKNLSFKFTRYIMPISGNENAQAGAPTDASIMADYAEGIEFDNIEIAHTGNNGIWFRTACSDSKLTHSYLHDLGIGGVKIGTLDIPKDKSLITNNIIVDNNIIRSGGHEFPTGVGVIIFQSGDNIISHNDISDFIYSGVSVGWVWGYHYSPSKRNKIIYNHIHHLGWGLLSDMGGVYTLGPSEGTVVNNNVIHHIYSYGYGGWGLYTDEGSTGIVMENNLVYKVKTGGFHQHYGKDNIIRNNIFALQLKAQLEATRIEDHRGFSFANNIVYFDEGTLTGKNWETANFLARSNIYWNTQSKDRIKFDDKAEGVFYTFQEWQEMGKDKKSIIADPHFMDPANYNFKFQNDSTISKIGFIPFDYSKAGVYGDEDWKELARFDDDLATEFEQMVKEREKATE